MPPIDSLMSSTTLNKTVYGSSFAECFDEIHKDSLIGSHYEIALALHNCTFDTQFSDGDFLFESGALILLFQNSTSYIKDDY